MSKERPILFNTEMVKAILEGRKTQTRRVMKSQPTETLLAEYSEINKKYNSNKTHADYLLECIVCPYGEVGDRLWVRETFWVDHEAPSWLYKADLPIHWDAKDTEHGDDVDIVESDYKWTPSIHMPRDMSRILLEITKIRVERVQDISEEDAKAEGVYPARFRPFDDGDKQTYKKGFIELWDNINASRKLGWSANPWVWVVEFKQVKP
jgi:hypothetical protein